MGLVLIFGAAASLYLMVGPKTPKQSYQTPPAALEETISPLLEDTDKDGLTSWEEGLYKTDPKNSDTDGDGTPDGEEIKVGRDPTVASPHDGINEVKEKAAQIEAPAYNLTKSLFEDFVKERGAQMLLSKDPEKAVQIIQDKVLEYQRLGKLPKYPDTPPELPPPAIRISNDNNEMAVKKYLNDLAIILETEILPLKEDDLSVFLGMLQSGVFDRTKKLKEYSGAVERTAKKVRALEVPQNLAWFHKKEILYIESAWRDIEKFSNIDKDPLTALLAVSARKNTKIAMIKLHYGELREWLKKNNIALSPQDKSYRLAN